MQPKGRSALQALTVTTIIRVPHYDLRRVAARHPAIAEAFWRDCSLDAAILSQWVVNVGRRDAKTRLAHLFCEMATRYKAASESVEVAFHFPVTQPQLADATGLTAVHVNRTLRALREDRLVSFVAGEVRIIDWPRLVAMGEFDPEYLQVNVQPAERPRIVELA